MNALVKITSWIIIATIFKAILMISLTADVYKKDGIISTLQVGKY